MTTLVKKNSKNNTTKQELINSLVNKNLSKDKNIQMACLNPTCIGF